ncbi:MAG: 4-vinyl reductase [Defluviitaleaceae bacterium]|nr:4-vinyl reductase [Defluviitaleaceae bacterium]
MENVFDNVFENVFETDDPKRIFQWDNLGDIKTGRGGLGEEMPVALYRLMQYTMVDVLSREFGLDKANSILRDSGYLAGCEFAENALITDQDFDAFVSHLQEQLKLLKIGILRMEQFDEDSGEVVLTIEEDLDCSGLPITGNTVCHYDEGFLAGILFTYTGKSYDVREIDCWATGNRCCRFRGIVI